MREGGLLLPHGQNGTLRIPLPSTVTLPSRLMEVRLSSGVVRLICQIPDEPRPQQTIIGVDLGVNTLLAATDGQKVVLISGRKAKAKAKATIQYRNQQLACLSAKQSPLTNGARRWKRVQRRTYRMLDKSKRQVRDLCHTATVPVVRAFPGALCSVGEPFNEAAQRQGRGQAEQVSAAGTAPVIGQLYAKTAGAITGDEADSSQTCPVCRRRSTPGRIYPSPTW